MPTRPLGNDTITIRVPTIVIDPDDGTHQYIFADGATVRNCSIQPFVMSNKLQSEVTVERESTTTYFRAYLPVNIHTLAIEYTYRIVFAGNEYEVQAVPGEWRHFSGKKSHVAFLLKRRIG